MATTENRPKKPRSAALALANLQIPTRKPLTPTNSASVADSRFTRAETEAQGAASAGMTAAQYMSAKERGEPGPNVLSIPIQLIKDNPLNTRKIYDDADSIEAEIELASSMQASGQLQPAQAYEEDGKYVLVFGHRRLRAAKRLNANTLNIVIVAKPESSQLFLSAWDENAKRKSHSPVDHCHAFSLAITSEGAPFATHALLAKAIGIDRTVITRAMRYFTLPEPVRKEIERYATRFSAAHLYELTLLNDWLSTSEHKDDAEHKILFSWVDKIANQSASVRDLRASLTRLKNPEPNAQRSKYPLQIGTTKMGMLRKIDNQLHIELALPNDEACEIVERAIQRALTELGKNSPPAT
jgi:ParB/RepB/Spo0J family partition protein